MKLAVVFGFCMLLLGPNLLWLNWSTVRIENRGSQSIEEAILFVCEQPVSLDLWHQAPRVFGSYPSAVMIH